MGGVTVFTQDIFWTAHLRRNLCIHLLKADGEPSKGDK